MKKSPEYISFLRAFIVWGFVTVILVVSVDRVLMPLVTGGFKKTVKIPDLKNSGPEKAEQALTQLGLVMVMDTLAEYNQEVEAGKIIKSRPVAESEVKKGRRVWVTISKGLKQLRLPDLKGFSVRQSEITLQQMGLKLGEIVWSKNNQIPVGVIYSSTPPAGTVVEPHSIVSLKASSGSANTQRGTPKLIGLSLQKSKRIISQLNLKLGKVEYQQSENKLPKTVLEQSPSPGVPFSANTKINLVISKE